MVSKVEDDHLIHSTISKWLYAYISTAVSDTRMNATKLGTSSIKEIFCCFSFPSRLQYFTKVGKRSVLWSGHSTVDASTRMLGLPPSQVQFQTCLSLHGAMSATRQRRRRGSGNSLTLDRTYSARVALNGSRRASPVESARTNGYAWSTKIPPSQPFSSLLGKQTQV